MKHLNKIHHYNPDLRFKDNQLIYVPTNTVLFKVDKDFIISLKSGEKIYPIIREKDEYDIIDAFTNFAYRLDELSKTLNKSKQNFIISDETWQDIEYWVVFIYEDYKIRYKVSIIPRGTKDKIREEISIEQNGKEIYEFNITNKSFSLLKKALKTHTSKKTTPQNPTAKPPENIDTQPSATETESETWILQNLEKFLLAKGLPHAKTKLFIDTLSYEFNRKPEILLRQFYKQFTNTFDILYRNKERNYFLITYQQPNGVFLTSLTNEAHDIFIKADTVKEHGLDISKEQFAKMIADAVIALRREKDEEMGYYKDYLPEAMKKYQPWLKKIYMEGSMESFAKMIASLANVDYTPDYRLNEIAVGVKQSLKEIDAMMKEVDATLAKILLDDKKLSNKEVIEQFIASIGRYNKYKDHVAILKTDVGRGKIEERINHLRKASPNLVKMVRAGIFNVNNIQQAKENRNFIMDDSHTLGYFKGEYNPSLNYHLSTDVRNVALGTQEDKPEDYTITDVYGKDGEQIYDLLMKKRKPFYKKEKVDQFLKLFKNQLTPQIIVRTKKNQDGSIKYEPLDLLLLALDDDEHIYIAPVIY